MQNKNTKIIFFFGLVLLSAISFLTNPAEASAACEITSARFSPSGIQGPGWYDDANRPAVAVTITGKDCAGTWVELSIVGRDAGLDDAIDVLDNYRVKFPANNSFYLNMQAGEDECEQTFSPSGNPNDCDYYIDVTPDEGKGLTTKGTSDRGAGRLIYECKVACNQSWKRVSQSVAGEAPASTVTPETNNQATGSYTLMAPIPGVGVDNKFDVSEEYALGKYINVMFKIFIGICAVLAMLMIVVGGLEYMTTELISSKEAAKSRIVNAILGLVLALSSYMILYTINPDLLRLDIKIPVSELVVEGPDAGDDTVDPNFSKKIYTFSSSSTISPGVAAAVSKLNNGWEISSFRVYRNNRMVISLKNGTAVDNTSIIDISPGLNGYAAVGSARSGDKKTPSGSWKIIEIRHTPGKAQFNSTGSNMGAAYWRLDPMTSGERGIGIHGNKNGTLGVTNGCIRMKNADLLALQPFIKTGITVLVDN